MKLAFRTGIFGLIGLAGIAAGCSSSDGGILRHPTGDIVLTDATTGQVINSSLTNPYLVPDLRFTIDATEKNFAGPYDVQIISQTNVPTASNGGQVYGFSFNQPCFTITEDPNLQASIPITFNGSRANGQLGNYPFGGVPTPQPNGAPSTEVGNPCHSGEFEIATISDTDGHTVKFYYEEYP